MIWALHAFFFLFYHLTNMVKEFRVSIRCGPFFCLSLNLFNVENVTHALLCRFAPLNTGWYLIFENGCATFMAIGLLFITPHFHNNAAIMAFAFNRCWGRISYTAWASYFTHFTISSISLKDICFGTEYLNKILS